MAFPNSRLSPPPSPFPPVAVPLSPLPPPHLTRPHTAAASLKGRFEVRVCEPLSLAAHRHHFTPPPHPAQRREKETLLSVQGRFIARSNHYPIHIPRHCTALPNAQRGRLGELRHIWPSSEEESSSSRPSSSEEEESPSPEPTSAGRWGVQCSGGVCGWGSG